MRKTTVLTVVSMTILLEEKIAQLSACPEKLIKMRVSNVDDNSIRGAKDSFNVSAIDADVGR